MDKDLERKIAKFKASRKKDEDHMPSISEAGKAVKKGVRESLDEWMLDGSDNEIMREYVKPGVATIADMATEVAYPEDASDIALAAVPGGKLAKIASKSGADGQIRRAIGEMPMDEINKRLSSNMSIDVDKMLPSEKRELLQSMVMQRSDEAETLMKRIQRRIDEDQAKVDAMPDQRDIY